MKWFLMTCTNTPKEQIHIEVRCMCSSVVFNTCSIHHSYADSIHSRGHLLLGWHLSGFKEHLRFKAPSISLGSLLVSSESLKLVGLNEGRLGLGLGWQCWRQHSRCWRGTEVRPLNAWCSPHVLGWWCSGPGECCLPCLECLWSNLELSYWCNNQG